MGKFTIYLCLNQIRKKSYIHLNYLEKYDIPQCSDILIQHLQGEEYKLFWPEQSEFVRMAARFGAKIVPFGVVGEDDIGQVSPEQLYFSTEVFFYETIHLRGDTYFSFLSANWVFWQLTSFLECNSLLHLPSMETFHSFNISRCFIKRLLLLEPGNS